MAQAEEDRRRRVLEERRRQQQAATDRFHSAITRLKQSRQQPQQERGGKLISTLPVESELNPLYILDDSCHHSCEFPSVPPCETLTREAKR